MFILYRITSFKKKVVILIRIIVIVAVFYAVIKATIAFFE